MKRARVGIGGVVAAAFWAIAAAGATMLPMTDPDTWWHIRVGREILDTGSVPSADGWSIAGAGREWISQDWASNVLMAALHDAGGPTAVSVGYGVLALLGITLLWDAIAIRRESSGWLARSSWLLFGIVLAAPVLGPRVQVVDFLLTAATLNVLWRYLVAPRRWHLGALPLIALVWVNLHAGFPLLFLLGGAVVVGEVADGAMGRGVDGPALTTPGITRLIGSLFAAAAVLAFNPNGIAIYAYPFETLGLGALSSFVGEWQPARLSAPAGQLLALFLLAGVFPTLLLARHRLRISDGLILVGLLYMAVTAVRFLLVAGPIGAAVVCIALAPAISDSPVGRSSTSLLGRLSRTPSGGRRLINAALVVVVVLAGTALITMRIGPDAQGRAIREVFPVDAVGWLDEHDAGDRIFNRYEWGGYLGLRRPHHLVFIDGRADLYGDGIIRQYVEVISVNENPQAYLDSYDIDHVLYPADSTLGHWLSDSPNWKSVYEDEVASIWVRD
jgi:hypothetical protein